MTRVKTKLKKMQTTMIRGGVLLLLAFTLTSCMQPTTKEAYLKGFEKFVADVEKNSGKFTESDWKWANKRFSRYTGEYFEKFREEMTLEEKIEVTLLKGRFLANRETSRLGRTVFENLPEEISKMGEDVKKYLDENLEEDLREISKGAREIGDSAVKVVEELLEELKKK